MKLPSFDNWGNGELSKIGIMILKNVNNKKCAPNFIFFNKKNQLATTPFSKFGNFI